MMKNYVNNHFNAVFDDYYKMATPRYISIIKVSMASVDAPTNTESDKLQEVKDLLKSGKNFGDIAKSYSDDNDTKNAKGSLGIVDTTSSLSDTYGSDVASTALTLTAGQTSEAIKGTNGYYFLYCSSTDKEKIKKELKNVDANSPLITYDNYMIYEAFKTYKITYQDKATKEAIKKVIDENLKNRAEEVPVKKTKKPINKKAIVGLVLAIVLAAGCIGGYYYVKNTKEADYVSKVTDGSKDLITGDTTVSKQGYYEYLMDGSGASEIVSQALTKIADKELTTKADKASIKTETKALEDQYKNYMGSVKDYAKSVGYSSEETFRKATLTPNAKQNALVKKYLTSKFTTAIDKYKVTGLENCTY